MAGIALAGLALASACAPAQAQSAVAPSVDAARTPGPSDIARPAGLPAIGKWMIDRDGGIAHWLGEILDGKALREPINIVLIDQAARDADDASRRIVAAATAAGYPVRFGHSTGYRGFIGNRFYAQLPAGRDDAFSNAIFELSNNHGRIFGPHRVGDAYVFIGAFSREVVRLFHAPHHGYASFNRARDDFASHMDARTAFRRAGSVALQNAIVGNPKLTTGDHDGRGVLLKATR